ncbi:hypothetical protein H4R19_004205 [Coemansia spiralis]|nr:hypothetical protein H4R19_004205 [Coemansia spiralis]
MACHSAIAADIAASLRRLPAGHSFAVHVVCTVDIESAPLTPQRRHPQYYAERTLARRVLVLVAEDGCLVAGLEAREFTTLAAEVRGDRTVRATVAVNACIEKLDTSGELSTRMPLARMVVAGYLCSLQKYQIALDIPSVGVHLFARAQHEYLFARSRENPRKSALDDLALIKWWKRTLDLGLAYAASAVSSSGPHQPACATTAHCAVPGSDPSEASSILGAPHATPDPGSPTVHWTWGLQYPAESRAHDCILQFPDDPMTRLLAEPHSSSWSVAMLFEMLAVGEECGAGHRAAYFSASLPMVALPDLPHADTVADASESADQCALSANEYDNVLLALFDHDMDFSCTNGAVRSSKRLFDALAAVPGTVTVAVSTAGPPASHSATTAVAAAAPPVNDLTAAIRKKRKVN